ncbi:MAG: hypothetical protein R3C16_04215 [Hyphomonadaceae bacterium]
MVRTWPQALDITSDIFIEAANRAAYDRFRAVAARWQDELRAWRCGLSAEDAARLTGCANDWRCDDVSISVDMIGFDGLDPESRERLGVLATRVTLPREDIDALIAGGRAGVAASPVAQALRR